MDAHDLEAEVAAAVAECGAPVFGTRASKEQYLAAKERFPQTVYDETSRIIRIEKNDKPHMGKIVVCSAGTADIFVAEEAALTAEYFGNYNGFVVDPHAQSAELQYM